MSMSNSLRDRIRERTRAVDELYRDALSTTDRRRVTRHGLGARVSHWLLVACFLTLLATGLMMYTGWYAPIFTDLWGGYYPSFGLHMWAGILVLAVGFVLFPFYHVVVDGHNPVPTRDDLAALVTVLLAFVGLRRYVAGYHRARRSWDADADHWVAYHPAQKFFWWTQLVLFALLAFTGFAMYDRMAADAPIWVGWLGAPVAWLTPEVQLQIHIVLAFALTGAVMMHLYFAVIPGNWDVVTSMLTGDLDAYVVHGDDHDRRATTDGGASEPQEDADQ